MSVSDRTARATWPGQRRYETFYRGRRERAEWWVAYGWEVEHGTAAGLRPRSRPGPVVIRRDGRRDPGRDRVRRRSPGRPTHRGAPPVDGTLDGTLDVEALAVKLTRRLVVEHSGAVLRAWAQLFPTWKPEEHDDRAKALGVWETVRRDNWRPGPYVDEREPA